MTRLAEEAMSGLRVLPDDMQDTIARHIIRRLREELECGVKE